MRKYFSENKCDETVKTIGEQSSLKAKILILSIQNKCLLIQEDSFGAKILSSSM